MPISMARSARYVTPRLFDGNIVGRPLSDRRITFYQKQGRYGPEYKQEQKERQQKKRKRTTLASLAKEFV